MSLFFKDDLKQLVLKQLNKQLKTELSVSGDAEFSLFSHFPNAGISLKEVALTDGHQKGDKLLEAESLTFLFNLSDIFKQQYTFEELVAENGAINIRFDKKGKSNYDIFRDADETTETDASESTINIKNAAFNNILFNYIDEKQEVIVRFLGDDVRLDDFIYKGTNYKLSIQGNGMLQEYFLDGETYVKDKTIEANVQLNIDSETGKYSFENSEFSLGGNDFKLNGSYTFIKDGYQFDLEFLGVDLEANNFMTLFSADQLSTLNGWELSGEMGFGAQISGNYRRGSMPKITANFNYENGKITSRSLGYPIKNVQFVANYTNGVLQHANTSRLDIQTLKGNLLGKPIAFSGVVQNLSNPILDLQAEGTLDLYAFKEWAERTQNVVDLSGEISFQNWRMKGAWADFKTSESYPESNGEIVFKDLEWSYNDGSITDFSGLFSTKNRNWLIERLEGQIGASKIQLSGGGTDLWAYLFQMNDSIPKNKVVPYFDLNFIGEQLTMKDLEAFRPPPIDSTEVVEAEVALPELPELFGKINLDFGKIVLENTSLENVKGEWCINGKIYRIYDLTFEVFGGNGTLSLEWKPDVVAHRFMTLQCELVGLDLKRMMKEMEDFDQEYLSWKNMNGRFDLNLLLQTPTDEFSYPIKAKLKAWADVRLANGELINFEPIMEMSEYEKKERLRKIRFEPIQTQLQVSGKIVKIPRMNIESNVVSIQFAGRHTFSNNIRYHFKVDLLDYFGKRFFNKNKGDAVEKNRRGGLNYYFSLIDEASDPDFKASNRKIVNQQFRKADLIKKINIDNVVNESSPFYCRAK